MAYITSTGTANPGHGIPQGKIAEFMTKGLDLDQQESDHLKVLYRATGIQQRYSVIPDYGLNGQPYTFYPKNVGLEPFPSIKLRMEQFKSFALDITLTAIDKCCEDQPLEEITHLITVSCTGMYAPGLDIELVEKLGFNPSIERTAINFMGCYAAFNALKIAEKIATTDSDANILIVCVELCSLHFQKAKEGDTLLANSLFGDGAAAVVVKSKPSSEYNLKLEKFYCNLETSGKEEMTWDIGDFGFEMRLSDCVPDVIERNINHLTTNLLSQLKIDVGDIDFFAVHPGGKKILRVIEECLNIPKEKNQYAHHVLKNYGNMSSPTIIFVLQHIVQSLTHEDINKTILSFAFGPGITMESMLLRISSGNSITS